MFPVLMQYMCVGDSVIDPSVKVFVIYNSDGILWENTVQLCSNI